MSVVPGRHAAAPVDLTLVLLMIAHASEMLEMVVTRRAYQATKIASTSETYLYRVACHGGVPESPGAIVRFTRGAERTIA